MHLVDRHLVAAPAVALPERRLQPRLVGPAQEHLDTAAWLLAREMSDAREMLAEADAAERVCQKLLDRLARLITQSGCQALLARAMHLAQADFRFLRGIQPIPMAGTYVEGLRESAEDTDPGQVHRGLATLLGTLIDLIALFIGDYLMGRMLLEVWPDLPVPDPTSAVGVGE